MANSVMVNVGKNFDLNSFAEQLANKYRAEGYNVNVANLNNSLFITFEKNTGGINMVLGLGEGIKASCMVSNGTMNISFSDGDWTGKIVGFIVGWFVCFIPIITALIGTIKQSSLPKKIGTDATMIAASLQTPEA